MGRMYAVTFDVEAETGQVDFFELVPADDKPLALHSIFIGQTTEVGDAAEEMLEVEIHRGGTGMTSGSGGTAQTPRPLHPTDAAAGFTAETLNTTLATFTSGVVVHRDAFNVRVGWQYRPTPEERIIVTQANGGLVVRLGAAPADSISWVGTAIVEELT